MLNTHIYFIPPTPVKNVIKFFTVRNTLIAVTIAIPLALWAGSTIQASPSADDILREAYELRTKARREHCKAIVQRMSDCYDDGDDAACTKKEEAFAWFQNEYGESHELACPKKDLPFGVGGQE